MSFQLDAENQASVRQGDAWVIGRDDDAGLALLRPIDPTPPYDFISLSAQAPTIGDQLGLVQYSAFSPVIDQRITSVSGYQPGGIGYSYMQIRAADAQTADGALLINEGGSIQGIRMPSLWLINHQIGNPGEVYAVDAAQVGVTAIPSLRSGRIHIENLLPLTQQPDDSPPAIPIIFNGDITIDGAPAPVGTRVYARLKKQGQLDHWTSAPIARDQVGFYILNVSAPANSYNGAIVEFWVNGRLSSMTEAYNRPAGSVVELNLAF